MTPANALVAGRCHCHERNGERWRRSYREHARCATLNCRLVEHIEIRKSMFKLKKQPSRVSDTVRWRRHSCEFSGRKAAQGDGRL